MNLAGEVGWITYDVEDGVEWIVWRSGFGGLSGKAADYHDACTEIRNRRELLQEMQA